MSVAAAPSPYASSDVAQRYDHDRFGGRFGRYLERQEVRLFTRLIGTHRVILDAGAGTGKLSVAWLREGLDVTSVDLARPMLERAARKAESAGVRTRPVLADVQALCFAERTFPCTVASRVLMHVADWPRALAELCRVTARVLVIDFPAWGSAAGVDAALRRRMPGPNRGDHPPYRTFRVGAVVGELARNGFRVTAIDRAFVLPLRWHRQLDRPEWSAVIERVAYALRLSRLCGIQVTLRAESGGARPG